MKQELRKGSKMKIRLIVIVLCGIIAIICAFFLTGNRVALYVDQDTAARKYMEQGDYPKAMAAMLDFYESTFTENYEAHRGARNTYGTRTWKELSSLYPPAAIKMREIRDAKELALRSGDVTNIPFDPEFIARRNPEGSKEATNALIAEAMFRDVVGLSEALDETPRAIALFEFMEKNHPRLAKGMWWPIRKIIMTERRYDIASRHIPDIYAAYQSHEARLNSRDRSRDVYEQIFTDDVKELLRMAVATGQTEAAEKIAADADKMVPNSNFEGFRKNISENQTAVTE